VSNPIGTSWAEPSFADTSWVAGSWGVSVPVIVQQPSGGGRRIPNKYESLKPRLARAAAIRRELAEERKRLAELKKQQTKVERQYREISVLGLETRRFSPALPKKPEIQPAQVDRARLLEAELREYAERVALQNAKVRALRKEAELAKRQAVEREADTAADEAMRAHVALLAQSEWQRTENARLQQEADDDEMQSVLLLIHDEDL
jgi:hypothetical protein